MANAVYYFIALVIAIVGVWGISAYAESIGACILICDASKEIAEARAERDTANAAADDANDRAEVAERELKGISPWVIVAAIVLFVLAMLINEMLDAGARNIFMKDAIRMAKEQAREYFGLVPTRENPSEGYTQIWPFGGQVVAGSKDSYVYAITFSKYRGRASYPPGHMCVTAYFLSTDPDRCTGWVSGMNSMEFIRFAKMAVQKTPNASDIAEQLERALRERQLTEVTRSVTGVDDGGN